jgi:thiol-disulfide isomerase/thioredoxin
VRPALRWAGLALLALALGCAHSPARPPKPDLRAALWLPWVGPVAYSPAAARGKVLLVTFFATWCFPCLGELPVLATLQRTYAAQGLQVLAVGLDLEGALVLEPFAQEYQLPFPILVADQSLRSGEGPFGKISVLPTSVILDRQGAPVAAWQGLAEPERLVQELNSALGR